MTKNYWEQRPVNKSSLRLRIAAFIKKSGFLFDILAFFYSNRVGDEYFIRKKLQKIPKHDVLLDVACGRGKIILVANSRYVMGVDIEGYPQDIAYNLGYKELTTYMPPDYNFSVSKQPEVVTCINLNAHIPFDSFSKILRSALDKCTSEGYLIMVNEYDNDAPSYRYFSKNKERKQMVVTGMEHYFFENEKSFLDKFDKTFPDLVKIDRRPLFCIVTATQYYWYLFKKDPSRFAAICLTVIDFFFGLANSLYIIIKGKKAEGFLVGYLLKKQQ